MATVPQVDGREIENHRESGGAQGSGVASVMYCGVEGWEGKGEGSLTRKAGSRGQMLTSSTILLVVAARNRTKNLFRRRVRLAENKYYKIIQPPLATMHRFLAGLVEPLWGCGNQGRW